MAFHAELLGLSLLFLPIGSVLAWFSGQTVSPLPRLCCIISALLFVLIVPRVVTLQLIDRSAKKVSGEKHCFFQAEVPAGAGTAREILTRDVDDLSFSAMLERGSRVYSPPHVTLITPNETWLWSFKSASFVPWERVERVGGVALALAGPAVIGEPSLSDIKRCDGMIAHT
jgi:hypothetical protein